MICRAGMDDTLFEFSQGTITIVFSSFEVGDASNRTYPVHITLYSASHDKMAEVTLTNEEFIHFILEWMRFNMEFSAPLMLGANPKTPSDFIKEIEKLLITGLKGMKP